MQTVFITKIIKVGSSQGIVIPIPILHGMKWNRGDFVVFGFGGNDQILLRRLTDKELRDMKPDINFN